MCAEFEHNIRQKKKKKSIKKYTMWKAWRQKRNARKDKFKAFIYILIRSK